MTYMITAEHADGAIISEAGESFADALAILESLTGDLIMLHVIMACKVNGEAHTLNRMRRDDLNMIITLQRDSLAWLLEHEEIA